MKREDLFSRTSKTEAFEEFIKGRGGDPKAIFAEAGFKSLTNQISCVRWQDLCHVYELCAQRLNDPYFGLRFASSRANNSNWQDAGAGPVFWLSAFAPNLLSLFDLLIEYRKTHTNGMSHSYADDPENQEISFFLDFHPLSPSCRQVCEYATAAMVIMGQTNLENYKLKRVQFQHRAPENLTLYQEVFDCPIIFNADRNMIVVDRALIEKEDNSHISRISLRIIKTVLNAKIKANSSTVKPISTMTTEVLSNLIGVNQIDIVSVASLLDLSPKKLQRLLKDEGTSFSALLNDLRKTTASRILIELSLIHI